eukprot:6484950-Amphidinium_carterae.2
MEAIRDLNLSMSRATGQRMESLEQYPISRIKLKLASRTTVQEWKTDSLPWRTPLGALEDPPPPSSHAKILEEERSWVDGTHTRR